jgi:hypothetical protein
MKNAIWLFLYFVINADRKTGFLFRKIRTISSDMGISKDSVSRWLRILKQEGYIDVDNTGRSLNIYVENWRSLPKGAKIQQQKQEISSSRCWKNPVSGRPSDGQNAANLSQEIKDASSPNDITIKRDILKSDIDGNEYIESIEELKPRNKRETQALEIAKSLNDLQALPLYLSYCKKYPDHLLRKVLGEVLEIPQSKIKKTRGALFNYLIQKYDKRDSKYSSN